MSARGPIICYNCQQPGHHIRDCPTRPANPQRYNNNNNNNSNNSHYNKGNYNNNNYNRNNNNNNTTHYGNKPQSTTYSGHKRVRDNESDNKASTDNTNNNTANIESTATTAESAESKLKSLLIKIGEASQTSLHTNLQLLSDAIVPELSTHSAFIQLTLLNCIKSLPHKALIYSTLLCFINAKNSGFAKEIIQKIVKDIKLALKRGHLDELRILTKFVASMGLVNLITIEDQYNYLHYLLSLIEKANTNNTTLHSTQIDHLLYNLLHLLPYIYSDQHQTKQFQTFNAKLTELILHRNQNSMNNSSNNTFLRVFDEKEHCEDLITNYFNVTQEVSNFNNITVIQRCYKNEDTEMLVTEQHEFKLVNNAETSNNSSSNNNTTNDETKTENTEMKIETKETNENIDYTLHFAVSNRLRPDLEFFNEISSKLKANPIERYIIKDWINDIILIFEAIHKEGTKQLINLPNISYGYSHLIVETLFENILTLPYSNHRTVYYASILIDLFKADSQEYPPLVGLLMNVIFEKLEEFDIELRDRLADWFGFHLSNFNYSWPWTDWEAVTETSPYTPQLLFVKAVLAKVTRLSFWERIQQTIPVSMLVCMPHQPSPAFRFASKPENNTDETAGFYYEAAQFCLESIRAKKESDVFIKYFTDNIENKLNTSAPLRIFIPSLLEAGKATYSHAVTLLDKYKPVITHYCTGKPQNQLITVNSIGEFWQHSLQNILLLLEKLIAEGIINSIIAIEWGFAQSTQLSEAFIWEFISMCMDFAINKPGARSDTQPHTTSKATDIDIAQLFIYLFRCFNASIKLHSTNQELVDILFSRCKQLSRQFSKYLLNVHSSVLEEIKKSAVNPKIIQYIQQAGQL